MYADSQTFTPSKRSKKTTTEYSVPSLTTDTQKNLRKNRNLMPERVKR